MADEAEERRLIDGFLARDPGLSAAFMAVLLPRLRILAFTRWPSLRDRVDEVESAALVLLARWLRAGTIDPSEGIDALVQRLVTRSAVEERTLKANDAKRKEALAAEPATANPDAEERLGHKELLAGLWTLLAGLSPGYQAALNAQAAATQGGPPVHVALGVEPATGRKTLERARQALLQRAIDQAVELPEWIAGKGAERG